MNPRSLLALGTGVGVQILDQDLAVTVVRLRPSGAKVLGHSVIAGFRQRPAGEWGAEYAAFLRRTGAGHLAATVLLPRREVIVRQLTLAGVSGRDLATAVPLQIDALHPYGEDEAGYAWARLPETESVLIGIAQRACIERYSRLFIEAGIKIASFTFSAAVLYSALRVLGEAPREDFLSAGGGPELEAYGESKARPVFSAILAEPAERSAAWAASELRLAPEAELKGFDQVLPAPKSAPPEFDLAGAVLSYATALSGAGLRRILQANLLPAELRSANSRLILVPTVALTAILLLLAAGLAAQRTFAERRQLSLLRDEIARVAPQAEKAVAAEKAAQDARNRARQLDVFHGRTQADLNTLQEITRLLEPPAWLNNLELDRTTVTIAGQCEQAAPLLKLLDSSPLFQNSEFVGQIGKAEKNQVFRIRMGREDPRQ
ncbi:MAG TPA: PilN domain-containing protein [Bryobacteraceae bacterium]|nr:PilN domain-containing protein [Bryobacteraceae bacterium]